LPSDFDFVPAPLAASAPSPSVARHIKTGVAGNTTRQKGYAGITTHYQHINQQLLDKFFKS
jgi:hypothetical protein